MKIIRIGSGVLNQTPLDWDGNFRNIVDAIEAARDNEIRLLCLPELCICGYGCEDAFHSVGVHETAKQVLQEIIPHSRDMIVSLGLPIYHQGALFNAAALVADGRLRGFVGKQNLAGEGLHYEPRWFKPWPDDVVVETNVGGEAFPLGDLIFDCGGVRLGFEICEDAWVANRPGGRLAKRGVDVVLNPSASHFAFGKHQVRRRFVLDGSRAFDVVYVYANLLGNEAGRAIYDGDAMIASCGTMLSTGDRFSFNNLQLTSATVDIDSVRVSRARHASYQPVMRNDRGRIRFDFDFPPQEILRTTPVTPPWEGSDYVKEEEFARAVSLGLFDYMRKSRSRGFVVSLSGGADSSAVATLCAMMVQFARRELDHETFCRKLPCLSNISAEASDQQIVRQLLTTVYQATRNSSSTTRDAAAAVANALGAHHIELEVDTLVDGYIDKITHAVGRELTWQEDDLTLQNIQARARGPSVWMLANLKGALLLATSNRSEAAVGYATMDGDTCGGLSPIAGIDKAFLRQWLSWVETTGATGLGRVPELSLVNQQAPTAELRPLEQGQTDEADLMPYDLLDAIERAAIRDKRMPLEVFHCTRSDFPQYSDTQLAQWIERFFRLWCRNQWKRERYAPSFHVDDENLDPKTWCRFPILSGGFERELRELREYLATQPAKASSNQPQGRKRN